MTTSADFADHIFLPTDFSDASESALSAASVLANQLGAKVTLFHTIDVESMVPPLSIDPDEYRRKIEAEVRGNVEKRLGEIRAAQLKDVEDVVIEVASERGAALAICEHAKAAGADLIIVATHGRTGLRKLLIGSVAEKVVRHAHCPVLAVRSAPEAD